MGVEGKSRLVENLTFYQPFSHSTPSPSCFHTSIQNQEEGKKNTNQTNRKTLVNFVTGPC